MGVLERDNFFFFASASFFLKGGGILRRLGLLSDGNDEIDP